MDGFTSSAWSQPYLYDGKRPNHRRVAWFYRSGKRNLVETVTEVQKERRQDQGAK